MTEPRSQLNNVVLPAGKWAIAVSGGADSVALLRMLCQQTVCGLIVAHLNHETRGAESDADEQFVAGLAANLGLPFDRSSLSQIQPLLRRLPSNRPALYREARLEFFRQVVKRHGLDGVLLAHHADDQAETIWLRLIRGSGFAGLTGMQSDSCISGLRIVRPLLHVRRVDLRRFLHSLEQDWREDASNASFDYRRNQARVLLQMRPHLINALVELAQACRNLHEWVESNAAQPGSELCPGCLAGPSILGHETARRWLIARGVPPQETTSAVIRRLISMTHDAASPFRQSFPGNVTVRRRRGTMVLEVDRSV